MIKNWKKSIISEKATLSQAIKAINSNKLKVAVITNKKNNVLGLLTDGDIRRAILNEKSLKTKALNVATKNPLVIPKNIDYEKIKQIMNKNDILQLPVVDKKNKIISIISSKDLSLSRQVKNPVLIMAGGFGKRLLPLTKVIPKPLLKIGNDRILDKIIENIKRYNFRKIFISVYYLSKKITEHAQNKKNWDLKVNYIREKKPLGTAGCLYYLKNKIKLPLIVMNGDIITSLNFEEMLNSHNKNKSDITIALQTHKINIPFAVLETDEIKIREINEKPTISKKVNAGIYIINPSIIDTFMKKPEFIDMPDLIKKAINYKKKVHAFPIHEDWDDAGNEKLKKILKIK